MLLIPRPSPWEFMPSFTGLQRLCYRQVTSLGAAVSPQLTTVFVTLMGVEPIPPTSSVKTCTDNLSDLSIAGPGCHLFTLQGNILLRNRYNRNGKDSIHCHYVNSFLHTIRKRIMRIRAVVTPNQIFFRLFKYFFCCHSCKGKNWGCHCRHGRLQRQHTSDQTSNPLEVVFFSQCIVRHLLNASVLTGEFVKFLPLSF